MLSTETETETETGTGLPNAESYANVAEKDAP